MQTSGFFEAVYDETLQDYDRKYLASQFAKYFSLFVGNGVFVSPTNQLKVLAVSGMNVKLLPGFAFINGYWYNNDDDISIVVQANTSGSNRTDSIVLRYSNVDRTISYLYNQGSTALVRNASYYDICVAQITVPTNAEAIFDSNITDTRSDENVCGFVKGLIDVVSTDDLFAQFESMFDAWFDTVKGQLAGDLGTRLQLEFDELNTNVNAYKTQTQGILNQSQALIDNYVNNDFVIGETTCVFTNKVCEILDSRITSASLIDVYFTAASIDYAVDAQITVDSYNGGIRLTAEETPLGTIVARFRVRVS